MKLFKWQRGRQSSCRYFKFPFLFTRIWRFGFDGYILAYPRKAFLVPHKDKIEGRMWRLNITLKGSSRFFLWKGDGMDAKFIPSSKRFHLFRPDLYSHALISKTRTYKLSLGFAIFKNN